MTKTVMRAGWKAKPPKQVDALPWPKVDSLVIHYSAAYSDEFPEYDARVRGIQNYHMMTNGWNDIAYNWLVSKTGIKFQGRGWGIMSAATLHHNDHTQAICFLGADKPGKDDVTDEGRRAISELIFDGEKRSGKKLGVSLKVGGHRDFVNTTCPGDELYHFVVTKGWIMYASDKKVAYPPRFFQWAAWWLGEGKFKPYGPRNMKVRPKGLAIHLSPKYWIALRQFLAARKGS